MKTKPITYKPTQYAKVPTSWKKAAGILRGRKPNPLQELRTMRKEWDKRLKKLEKSTRK